MDCAEIKALKVKLSHLQKRTFMDTRRRGRVLYLAGQTVLCSV